MQSFLNWLVGEAGAGWIVGLLGLLCALYTWFQRERPRRVIIQEVNRVRLLDIHPSQLDKVSVFYTDTQGNKQPISNLEQKKIVIYNNGPRDILDPLHLTLRFCEKNSDEAKLGFHQLVLDDPDCTVKPITDSDAEVQIEIPHLNSYPKHKQYIPLYLISAQEMEIELLKRFGKGWSASFISLSKFEKRSNRLKFVISGLGCVITAIYFIMLFTSPALRPWLDPTPENINAALQAQRAIFEARQATDYLGLLKASFHAYGVWFFISFLLLSSLAIFSLMRKKIAELIFLSYSGARPLSEFEPAPSGFIDRTWDSVKKFLQTFTD